jgi:hypothetical protein
MDIPVARNDPQTVLAALKNAATVTGSDFHYLLGTAMRESSLRPDAHSGTSSAAGLFQFVDQTWLGLVKDHGAQYGLGDLAQAIRKDGAGRYHAAESDRRTILALRSDPRISALMAGEYAKTTQNQMKANLGRPVCGGELYAAHFLGPDAACKLIRLAGNAPDASAAAQFPEAAHANRNVFYHHDGEAKTVREVYDWALRQPGDEGAVRAVPVRAPAVASTPAQAQTAMIATAQAGDSEVRMLLASVTNWQPGQSLFGAGPQSGTLSFNAGLLSLLSDSKG